ncbi:MAG TPA: OmpH family outer membrane protein [Geminicoccus sp.]|uniref:OmpH family outer membrane protein n=1 Tax=Geminicoccus sp. TaxID=2024832 RepID=UPI002C8EF8A5|nr:OmpH family outer membrane protein [Geminicoccus sp.]HWL68858.1 OmpH family outer membrane protein [Geminicoccus sp.]
MPVTSCNKAARAGMTAVGRMAVRAAMLAMGVVLPAAAQQQPAQPLPSTIAGATETLPAAVVGIIDYQKILRDSKAAGSIRDQVEVRRKAYQEEISKQEQELREQDQALVKQRTVLSPEAFGTKRREFEQEVAEVQKNVQARRRQLDEVTAVALSEVREAIIEVVSQLAEAKGFNLVVPSSTVLVFSPRIDITQDVLQLLDERLPDVKVADALPAEPPQQQQQ